MSNPDKFLADKGIVTEFPNSRPVRLSIPAGDFLAKPIPIPTPLLPPILNSGESCMCHAWRGVGKTHFSIGAAGALSTASTFLRWKAPKPVRVLYIDGEMPAYQMQNRFHAMLANCNPLPSPEFLRIITPDMLPDNILVPNLNTPEGQATIEPDLAACEVVIFDNVASLFRGMGDTNTTESWEIAQNYILRLRRRGIAVLLIDHDNKSKENRGTSAKADVLDTVIHLKAPKDYLSSQGCRFEVHFSKHRHFYGRDATPFEAQLVEGATGPTWAMRSTEDLELDRFAEMVAAGASERAIRAELGVGGSKITSLKTKLASRGKE